MQVCSVGLVFGLDLLWSVSAFRVRLLLRVCLQAIGLVWLDMWSFELGLVGWFVFDVLCLFARVFALVYYGCGWFDDVWWGCDFGCSGGLVILDSACCAFVNGLVDLRFGCCLLWLFAILEITVCLLGFAWCWGWWFTFCFSW